MKRKEKFHDNGDEHKVKKHKRMWSGFYLHIWNLKNCQESGRKVFLFLFFGENDVEEDGKNANDIFEMFDW